MVRRTKQWRETAFNWPHSVVDRFEKLKRCEGGRCPHWQARCPAHNDNTPSLTLWLSRSTGVLCVRCWAGCDTRDILRVKGLQMGDLFPPDSNQHGPYEEAGKRKAPREVVKRKIVETFDYTDEEGGLIFQTVRYEPKDFSVRRPGPGSGEWIWDLDGVRLVPYRLPKIVKAHKEMPVLIVEGERKVHMAESLGFIATCNAMGAKKWYAQYSQLLEGRRVVILPDNDAVGDQHAEIVAGSLMANGVGSLRIVHILGLPDHGDIIDFVEEVGKDKARQKLIEIIRGFPEWVQKK